MLHSILHSRARQITTSTACHELSSSWKHPMTQPTSSAVKGAQADPVQARPAAQLGRAMHSEFAPLHF